MDEEGFSGRDGRTTIFDYWSLAKLQRLEAVDYAVDKLEDEEASLLADYRQLAPLYTLPEVSEGGYYGLIPLGQDAEEVIAYVRFHERSLLLVLANFSTNPKEASLTFPETFFTMAGIKAGSAFRAVDKLSSSVDYLALTSWASLRFFVGAEDLRVLSLTPLES